MHKVSLITGSLYLNLPQSGFLPAALNKTPESINLFLVK
jgi:hypothetical protein